MTQKLKNYLFFKNSKDIGNLIKLFGQKTLKKLQQEKQFKGDESQAVQLITDLDPTPNKEYSLWLVKAYVSNGIQRFEDIASRAVPAIKQFISLKNRKAIPVEKRDIMQYPTLGDLEDLIESQQKPQ